MAYSNVTPPVLPDYDSETNGFYVLVFNYEKDSEDWYMVHLIYSSWRFHYEEGLGVTNTGTSFTRMYADGVWSEELPNTETLALNPGERGGVFQRIYTNENIFAGEKIWLAADTVTPVEKFPIRDFLIGMILGSVSRGQFPQREPVEPDTPVEPTPEPIGYLYGETNVGIVGFAQASIYGPLPDESEWHRTEYPYAVVYYTSMVRILFVSKEPWYGTGEPYMFEGKQFGETIKNDSSGLWFFDGLTDDRRNYWRLLTEEQAQHYEQRELGQNKDTNGDGIFDYGTTELANWSNHPIMSADGKTVLVPKTDPIPVYE